MKPVVFALALCGVAAACVPQDVGVTEPLPVPIENACGAEQLQYLVGQPARVLETMRFRGETRIIRPDTAVTMDFRAERLNIAISRAERISRVYCS
jgi:hypothetical protein